MSRQGYQYVVLRCVPRVEREEFVNVGVVLYCQGADFLDAAYQVDEDRLRALAPEADLAAVTPRSRPCAGCAAGSPVAACRPSAGWAGGSGG